MTKPDYSQLTDEELEELEEETVRKADKRNKPIKMKVDGMDSVRLIHYLATVRRTKNNE